jgi:hypothetical protein
MIGLLVAVVPLRCDPSSVVGSSCASTVSRTRGYCQQCLKTLAARVAHHLLFCLVSQNEVSKAADEWGSRPLTTAATLPRSYPSRGNVHLHLSLRLKTPALN